MSRLNYNRTTESKIPLQEKDKVFRGKVNAAHPEKLYFFFPFRKRYLTFREPVVKNATASFSRGKKLLRTFPPKKGSIRKKNVTRFLRRGQRSGQAAGRKKGARLSRTRLVFPPAPLPRNDIRIFPGKPLQQEKLLSFFCAILTDRNCAPGKSVINFFLTDKSFRIMKTKRFTGWTGNFIKLRPDLEYCFSLVRTQRKNLFLCIKRFEKSQLTN